MAAPRRRGAGPSTGGIELVPEHLDPEPIPLDLRQPIGVGADVQDVEPAQD